MINSKIALIASHLPIKVLTNNMLSTEFPEWNSEKIEKKIGILSRHIADENETALDLAFEASKKALKHYDIQKIGFLILCTQSPEYLLPTTACILQSKLGLGTNVGAFDFNLGCSGYIYGLALAKSLILANMSKSVLLVTSETYSKYLNPQDFSNRSIFGDGATATIIEFDQKEHIHDFVFGTDGNGACNLIVPNGGTRNKYEGNPKILNRTDSGIRTANDLYMNGPEIFNFTIETIPKLIDDVLYVNKTKLSEINYFVFHQANKFILDYLRKKLDIPENKFHLSMEKTGNTVSSTIPIALQDCFSRNIVKKGDKVLLCGFGVGYSWAATIITI